MRDTTQEIIDAISSGPKPLPCPLCGGEAYAFRAVNGTQMFHVGCPPCGLELKAAWYRGQDKPTKDILALWNTRPLVPSSQPETPTEKLVAFCPSCHRDQPTERVRLDFQCSYCQFRLPNNASLPTKPAFPVVQDEAPKA